MSDLYVVTYGEGTGNDAVVGVADNWDFVEEIIKEDIAEQGEGGPVYSDYDTVTVTLNKKVF